jgi:EAL domain-containing protein (putative c-di-GMP-specific phosphodiesterase class I)
MINNFDKVSSTIDELRHMGLSISLDDFGSGYSSLNYLAILSIDEIKIDKSFIDLINRDSKVNAMIEMIINLSKAYKINIVAEGVETYEQFDYLKDMGCAEIQGYLFSKPEPL